MKKLLLLLILSQLAVLAMEQPAAAGRKRPAIAGAPEDIELLKEADEPQAPAAKQARPSRESTPVAQAHTLKKVYTLKVPVPGSAQTIDELINIDEIQDTFAAESIAELIEAANLEGTDFVLARIPTSTEGKRHTEYYEATNIQKSLFGNLNAPNANTIGKYTLKTPLRAPIIGEIYYYLYSPSTDSFDYLGTDYEFFSEGKNPILSNTLAAIIDPQNAIQYWNALRKIYLEKNLGGKATYYQNKIERNALMRDPQQKQKIAQIMYRTGSEAAKDKNYKKALLDYNIAYKLGYDLAAVQTIIIYRLFLKENRAAITPEMSQTLQKYTNNLIAVLQKYPGESILTIFPNQLSREAKIQKMNTTLKSLLDENISSDSKAILQQKLEELQRLK